MKLRRENEWILFVLEPIFNITCTKVPVYGVWQALYVIHQITKHKHTKLKILGFAKVLSKDSMVIICYLIIHFAL